MQEKEIRCLCENNGILSPLYYHNKNENYVLNRAFCFFIFVTFAQYFSISLGQQTSEMLLKITSISTNDTFVTHTERMNISYCVWRNGQK